MFNITNILLKICLDTLLGDIFYRNLQFCRLTIDEYIFKGPLYEILWL